jgi:hypothetical protein
MVEELTSVAISVDEVMAAGLTPSGVHETAAWSPDWLAATSAGANGTGTVKYARPLLLYIKSPNLSVAENAGLTAGADWSLLDETKLPEKFQVAPTQAEYVVEW